jgi:hypothetical protein
VNDISLTLDWSAIANTLYLVLEEIAPVSMPEVPTDGLSAVWGTVVSAEIARYFPLIHAEPALTLKVVTVS